MNKVSHSFNMYLYDDKGKICGCDFSFSAAEAKEFLETEDAKNADAIHINIWGADYPLENWFVFGSAADALAYIANNNL